MAFRADFTGIGEMLRSAEMQADMRRRAENVAQTARAIAPVGPETGGTHYRDSFEVSSGVRPGETGRAYGRVTNDSDHAAAIEFGNGRTRRQTIAPQHVLGKALNAAGD